MTLRQRSRSFLLLLALSLPTTELAAQSPRPGNEVVTSDFADPDPFPGNRFLVAVNDDQLLSIGLERPILGSRLAVHTRLAPVSSKALVIAGVRGTLVSGSSGEINGLAGGGWMRCRSLIRGTCPIDTRSATGFRPVVGGTVQAVGYGVGDADDLAIGLEVGYWNRPGGGSDPGFDLWTGGLVVYARFP